MTQNHLANHVKVNFPLIQDDSGYPPFQVESLWALLLEGCTFQIDNIPFFAREVSKGDVVSATYREEEWWFQSVISPSGHSTIRVIVFNDFLESHLQGMIDKMTNTLGCTHERSGIADLISFDIPSDVNIDDVLSYLDAGEVAQTWTYEIGTLRSDQTK